MGKLNVFTSPTLSNPQIDLQEKLSERVKSWKLQLVNFGTLAPNVQQALKATLKEMAMKPNLDSNTLYFDTKIVKHVLTNSQNNNNNHNFLNHARTIFSSYSTQITSLSDQLNDTHHQQFKERVIQINGKLRQIAQSTSTIENMLETTTQISSLLTTNLSLSPQQVGQVGETLLKSVVNVAGQQTAFTTNLTTLMNELNTLKNENSPNVLAIAKRELQIENFIMEGKQEAAKFTRILSDMNQGIDFAGFILGASGHINLAQKVTTIGKAAVTIVQNLGIIAQGGAVLGPAGLIGGSVISILGAFGVFGSSSQPSPEQQMLEKLHEQIGKLSTHVDKRFDRVEKILEVLGTEMVKCFKHLEEKMDIRFNRIEQILDARFNHLEQMVGKLAQQMHGRFDHLENMLTQIYSVAIREFAQIGRNQARTEREFRIELGNIANRLQELQRSLDEGLSQVALQSYTDIRARILNPNRTHPLGFTECFDAIVQKILPSTEPSLQGGFSMPIVSGSLSTCNERQICERVLGREKNGINYNINFLVQFAIDHSNSEVTAPNALPNPRLFEDAILLLMNLLKQGLATEDFNLTQAHLDSINNVIGVGKQINNFVLKVKTSGNLFAYLIKNYQTSLLSLINNIYEIIFPDTTLSTNASHTPENVLKRAEAVKLGPTYIHEFTSTPNFPFKSPLQLKITSPDEKTSHYQGNPLRYVDDALAGHFYGCKMPTNPYPTPVKAIRNAVTTLCNTIEIGKTYVESSLATYQLFLNPPPNKQLAILKEGAIVEKNKARAANRLPNLDLMKKYFSMENRSNLDSIISTACTNNQGLKTALENLNSAYILLTVFLSLAFNEEYQFDTTLRFYLQKGLWDSKDFIDYLSQGDNNNNANFVLITLQSKILPFIEEAQTFVLKKVFTAQFMRDTQQEQVCYPMVDNALKQLEAFKSVYFCHLINQPFQQPTVGTMFQPSGQGQTAQPPAHQAETQPQPQ